MYKVLIAEDEQTVLDAIIKTIDWSSRGFAPPVACHNGKEAMTALENFFVPDVIITDICMPIADGFALIKYANEHCPSAKIIILSGYDDFKYAQKAIALSVYDYLLKPITPNQIYDLLEKLKDELDRPNLMEIEKSMKIISGYFLNRLLTKKLDYAIIHSHCQLHKLIFCGDYHAVALIDVESVDSTMPHDGNQELMRYGLQNIATEITQDDEHARVFQMSDGVTALIYTGECDEDIPSQLSHICNIITATVKNALDVHVSIGVGENVYGLDKLYLSHNQARTALSYKFLYGDGSIIYHSSLSQSTLSNIEYLHYEKEITIAITQLQIQQTHTLVADFVQALRLNRVALIQCLAYSQRLLIAILSKTAEMTNKADDDYIYSITQEGNLFSILNLDELLEFITSLCDKTFEILSVETSGTIAAQIKKAERYIKENYWDSKLSLNMVTDHVSISSSYFSNVFKAKTGMTFVEYLTQVRMEKAKQSLLLTDKKNYEIADEVGFADAHYFSVAFKRVTGMTPKEYRINAR